MYIYMYAYMAYVLATSADTVCSTAVFRYIHIYKYVCIYLYVSTSGMERA